MRRTMARFRVDRENGKVLGVCAALGERMGIDPLFLRVGLVLATIAGGFPWTFIAYGLVAWAGRERRIDIGGRRGVAVDPSSDRLRNLDLRMQAIETYVTSSNSALAREIDELR